MQDCYLLMNGVKTGPMSGEVIQEYLSKGKINANQMVSIDGEVWLRLYELQAFNHLAEGVKVDPGKKVLGTQLAFSKLLFVVFNLCFFALFMLLNLFKYGAGYFGVWLQLLMVGVYSVILSELISDKGIKRQIDIVGYLLVAILWMSVVMGVLRQW